MRKKLVVITPALLLAFFVAVSAPAQALYISTPLHVTPSSAEADVGDDIDFTITPNDDHEGPSYAGQIVTIRYAYDPEEGQHEPSENPDEPVSSDDEAPGDGDLQDRSVTRDAVQITLDADSRAAFTWTVPEEVADRNVFLYVVSENGETLASAHVRVGDAEQMAFIMQEGAPEPDEGTATNEPGDAQPPATDTADDGGPTVQNDTPAPGLMLVAGSLALIAAAMRRRRS